MKTLSMILLLAGCVIAAAALSSIDTPAHGQPLAGCGPGTGAEEGPSTPIPNDPDGLKGWFHRDQEDDAGNRIEVWCIEIAGGVGNSFGYRYIPAGGGTPRWFARCAFVGGVNIPGKEPTGDTNENGQPDGWTKLTHTTEDDGGGGQGDPKDDDQVAGKKDYDWEYNPANNNLKRWETNNGVRINPNNPDYDGPAPEHFSGLFAVEPPENPGQDDDMKDEPKVKVKLVSHLGTDWHYGLNGNPLSEFSPTMIYTGDKWSMAVDVVTAATAPVGWSVNFTSSYVTWTYTDATPINLSSAGPLSGFAVTSPQLGTPYWLSDSADDDLGNFGYAGIVDLTVGGTTEVLVEGSDAPHGAAENTGSSAPLYAAIASAADGSGASFPYAILAGSVAAMLTLIAAGGWYTRRRWLR
jgi:hypothetical protein